MNSCRNKKCNKKLCFHQFNDYALQCCTDKTVVLDRFYLLPKLEGRRVQLNPLPSNLHIMKHPACHCVDGNFCTVETCNSSSNCIRTRSPYCYYEDNHNMNQSCIPSCNRQQNDAGGGNNADEYDHDLPGSRKSSTSSNHQEEDELSSNQEEDSNELPYYLTPACAPDANCTKSGGGYHETPSTRSSSEELNTCCNPPLNNSPQDESDLPCYEKFRNGLQESPTDYMCQRGQSTLKGATILNETQREYHPSQQYRAPQCCTPQQYHNPREFNQPSSRFPKYEQFQNGLRKTPADIMCPHQFQSTPKRFSNGGAAMTKCPMHNYPTGARSIPDNSAREFGQQMPQSPTRQFQGQVKYYNTPNPYVQLPSRTRSNKNVNSKNGGQNSSANDHCCPLRDSTPPMNPCCRSAAPSQQKPPSPSRTTSNKNMNSKNGRQNSSACDQCCLLRDSTPPMNPCCRNATSSQQIPPSPSRTTSNRNMNGKNSRHNSSANDQCCLLRDSTPPMTPCCRNAALSQQIPPSPSRTMSNKNINAKNGRHNSYGNDYCCPLSDNTPPMNPCCKSDASSQQIPPSPSRTTSNKNMNGKNGRHNSSANDYCCPLRDSTPPINPCCKSDAQSLQIPPSPSRTTSNKNMESKNNEHNSSANDHYCTLRDNTLKPCCRSGGIQSPQMLPSPCPHLPSCCINTSLDDIQNSSQDVNQTAMERYYTLKDNSLMAGGEDTPSDASSENGMESSCSDKCPIFQKNKTSSEKSMTKIDIPPNNSLAPRCLASDAQQQEPTPATPDPPFPDFPSYREHIKPFEGLVDPEKVGMQDNTRLIPGGGYCCMKGKAADDKIVKTPTPPTQPGPKSDCECFDKKKKKQKGKADAPDCKKKGTCLPEDCAVVCASTTCVNEQNKGCPCRYPPAFQQLSCAGNLSGYCKCEEKD